MLASGGRSLSPKFPGFPEYWDVADLWKIMETPDGRGLDASGDLRPPPANAFTPLPSLQSCL